MRETRNVLSHSPGGRKSKMKTKVPGESLLPEWEMIASSLSPHVAERQRERTLTSLPIRTLILLYKDPTRRTSVTLLPCLPLQL